jgi:hypothetical protein
LKFVLDMLGDFESSLARLPLGAPRVVSLDLVYGVTPRLCRRFTGAALSGNRRAIFVKQ